MRTANVVTPSRTSITLSLSNIEMKNSTRAATSLNTATGVSGTLHMNFSYIFCKHGCSS